MGLKWKIAQAAEIKWWNNYLKNKDKSSYYDWKRSYWSTFLKDIDFDLPRPPARILDAGSGPAGIFTILSDHQTVAVDPLLDKYISNLDQFEISDFPNVEFITSTIERIHMDNNSTSCFASIVLIMSAVFNLHCGICSMR